MSAAGIAAEVERMGGQPVSAQAMRRTLYQTGLHDLSSQKQASVELKWCQNLTNTQNMFYSRPAIHKQTQCGLYVNLICSMYIIVWIIMFLRVFTAATVCKAATVMIHHD